MGNMSRPGTIVVREIDHPAHVVAGRNVFVRELHWNLTTGLSFDVYDADTQECLTDESYDEHPGDDQIAGLLGDLGESWTCPGCGCTVDGGDVGDHVRDCDKVDGAGHART